MNRLTKNNRIGTNVFFMKISVTRSFGHGPHTYCSA